MPLVFLYMYQLVSVKLAARAGLDIPYSLIALHKLMFYMYPDAAADDGGANFLKDSKAKSKPEATNNKKVDSEPK